MIHYPVVFLVRQGPWGNWTSSQSTQVDAAVMVKEVQENIVQLARVERIFQELLSGRESQSQDHPLPLNHTREVTALQKNVQRQGDPNGSRYIQGKLKVIDLR